MSSTESTNASLTVVRVDPDPKLGPIVFVSVGGVRQPSQTYNFFPMSEDALQRSVVALIRTNASMSGNELQVFQDFYESGRQGVEAGKLNKCFKTTVAEVLDDQRKNSQ